MASRSTFDEARERVLSTPELRKYQDTLLMSDWSEGEDHWRWVATAPVDEIVQRAEEFMDEVVASPEAVEEVEEDI